LEDRRSRETQDPPSKNEDGAPGCGRPQKAVPTRETPRRKTTRETQDGGVKPPLHERQVALVDGAVEDGGDLLDFVHEVGEFGGEDGLDAVGEGSVGLVMDFDEEAIGTDGDGGAGERKNFVALAGAVAGIDEDGKMAAFFYGGNYG